MPYSAEHRVCLLPAYSRRSNNNPEMNNSRMMSSRKKTASVVRASSHTLGSLNVPNLDWIHARLVLLNAIISRGIAPWPLRQRCRAAVQSP